MDPRRSNFSELERFIKSSPLQADSLAKEWGEFVERFKNRYPEVARFESGDQFFTWAQRNPQLHIDTTLWRGKEITEAYDYIRNQHEQQETEIHGAIDNSSVPVELLTLPFLATAFNQKKILEDDRWYKKQVEEKKKSWLKENNRKDFLSEEGLRFLYGDPNDKETKGVYELAREEFAKDPKNAKKLEKLTAEKEKVYKNPKDDRALELAQNRIAEMKNSYYSVFKKQHPEMEKEQLEELVKKTTDPLTEKEYDHFALRHVKRANAYAPKDKHIQQAVERTASKHMAEATRRFESIPQLEQAYTRTIPAQPTPPQSRSSASERPFFPTSGSGGRVVNTANKLLNRVFRGGQVQNAASKAAMTVGKNVASRVVFLLGAWGGPILLITIMLFTFVLVGFASDPGNSNSNNGTPIISFPSGTPSSNQTSASDQAAFLLNQRSSNIPIYKQASSMTGVPWEILAGIHYMEGGFNPNGSLVSGRQIGANEPDVRSCAHSPAGPGIPVPLPSGGCGFNTLLDSAIYAGNHLKGKVGGDIASFEETTTALSRYNGGGNRNCDDNPPYQRRSPYSGCPRLYEGEDDPYVFNFFDARHDTMYLIYCADFQTCNPPRVFSRPGIMTVVQAINKSSQ